MPDLATNVLYYGDNLDILRRYLPDAAIDLVYLDPPDNVILRDESGSAKRQRPNTTISGDPVSFVLRRWTLAI